MIFKAPAGMKDILPEEAFLWQNLEEKARKVFTLYGYLPIRTPEVEDSSLFNRSLGQETEVVKKQMFLIQREKETYCLRPEATAAVVRAYIENGLDKTNQFSKLYYLGAMFRAERPQKGRLRQFHHIGVEALGAVSPYLDAEVIALAIRLLDEFGISGYQLKLNSLGCRDDRKRLSDILLERLLAQ
jgi:histidyl-tRNA synthetase